MSDEFPRYEVLWRRYIVNRLEDLPHARQIRFRRAMKDFELFAMSHYSVFVSFARAVKRLQSLDDEDQLASDVFYKLDTSLDNVKAFFERLPALGKLVSVDLQLAPPKQDKDFPELRQITDYRDTLLHNPVLGRAVGQGIEMIPVHSELEEAKKSWLYCEDLPMEKRVNTRDLLEHYHARYALYLNTRWGEILSAPGPPA